jgi:hypothetical protein
MPETQGQTDQIIGIMVKLSADVQYLRTRHAKYFYGPTYIQMFVEKETVHFTAWL